MPVWQIARHSQLRRRGHMTPCLGWLGQRQAGGAALERHADAARSIAGLRVLRGQLLRRREHGRRGGGGGGHAVSPRRVAPLLEARSQERLRAEGRMPWGTGIARTAGRERRGRRLLESRRVARLPKCKRLGALHRGTAPLVTAGRVRRRQRGENVGPWSARTASARCPSTCASCALPRPFCRC